MSKIPFANLLQIVAEIPTRVLIGIERVCFFWYNIKKQMLRHNRVKIPTEE